MRDSLAEQIDGPHFAAPDSSSLAGHPRPNGGRETRNRKSREVWVEAQRTSWDLDERRPGSPLACSHRASVGPVVASQMGLCDG